MPPSARGSAFDEERCEQAERRRAQVDWSRAQSLELQRRSEETNERVATRQEETRRYEADLRAREREAAARQLAREQRAREDQDREQ